MHPNQRSQEYLHLVREASSQGYDISRTRKHGLWVVLHEGTPRLASDELLDDEQLAAFLEEGK